MVGRGVYFLSQHENFERLGLPKLVPKMKFDVLPCCWRREGGYSGIQGVIEEYYILL